MSVAEGFIDDANHYFPSAIVVSDRQMNELKQKGTHFNLRVLQDEQAAGVHGRWQSMSSIWRRIISGIDEHPKLREAAIAATKKYGVGSGAVRTVSGPCQSTWSWKKRLRGSRTLRPAWCFQSGFAANAGTVSAILGQR